MASKAIQNKNNPIEEANALFSSGLKHSHLRHHDEALIYFQQCLKVLQENKLLANELTEKVIIMIADAYDSIANAQPENLQYRIDTLKLMNESFPDSHPASCAQIARMYNNLADNYRKIGNFKEALSSFAKCILALKDKFPFGSHPYYVTIKENINALCSAVNDQGVALFSLGKNMEALEALEDSFYVLNLAFPEGNNMFPKIREYLAKILINLHKEGVELLQENKKEEALKIFIRISDSFLKNKVEPASNLL